MNGDDKAKKLSAAKKRLKEFQKKQTTDVAYEKVEQYSHGGSVDEEHHSVGSGRPNGSIQATATSSSIGLAIPSDIAQQPQPVDDIDRLQLERNLSPPQGNPIISEPPPPTDNNQLLAQIEELKSYNVSLQKQILDEREAFGEQMQLQLGQLREQIQIHAQTIGILVGEKSQLQAALSQTKLAAESRQNENQELTGRLSASRQRVADLEKQATVSTEQLQKHEKTIVEISKQIEKARAENASISNSTQELKRRHDELQERYLNKESECSSLAASVSALKNELSMTKVLLEQLSANASKSDVSESQQISSQNEQLKAQNQELSRLLKQANETAESYRVERDNFKRRHQTDLTGFEDHIRMLNGRINALSNEIEGHLQRNSQLETQLSEANEKLRVAQESTTLTNQGKETKQDESMLADLKAKDSVIASISQQLTTAKRDLEELVANNVHIHQALVDKDATVETLRSRIVELERASSDYRSVLTSVEDVRTALSRALAQNGKLKSDYEELQNAFVRITNEKAELADQLVSAQKSMSAATAPLPPSPSTQVETREVECEVKFADEPVAPPVLPTPLSRQSENEENHGECNHNIAELESRISEYSRKIAELELKIAENNDSSSCSSSANEADIPATFPPHQQLPIDIAQFASQNRAEQLGTVQNALLQLEDRFGRVMREKADLLDQKERLEHLVIQLQSETDTIGEYITLYQKQRTTLKQQAEENARFMKQLSDERTVMKTRMAELQSLVLKMVASRSQEPVRVVSTGPDFATPERGQRSSDSSNQEKKEQEEEWPDLVGEDASKNESDLFIDAPPDPVSSRILQLLTSMTSSMLTQNEDNGDDAKEMSLIINEHDAAVLQQMTPNTRRLVNRRLHSLRSHPPNKQSPGECPCCRGQVIVI